MGGIFKPKKPKALPPAPAEDAAVEKAAADDLERRRQVNAGGKQSTILAGKSVAEDTLKNKLGQ